MLSCFIQDYDVPAPPDVQDQYEDEDVTKGITFRSSLGSYTVGQTLLSHDFY